MKIKTTVLVRCWHDYRSCSFFNRANNVCGKIISFVLS